MAGFLYRVGGWVVRHRVPVLLLWVVLAVGLTLAVRVVGSQTSDDLSLPGTDSQAATDLLAARFPPQQNGKSPVVFRVATGTVETKANKDAIQASVAAIQKVDHVVSAPSPYAQGGAAQVSKDKTTAFVPVLLDIGSGELSVDEAERVLDAAEPARAAGMRVAVGGPVGSELSKPETESSEIVGIALAMIILTLAFGTVVAMGMPILTAILALAPSLALIGLIGHLVTIPTIAPTLGIMIGLGVGIDYALFLVTRHRNQVREGVDPYESIARAVGTTGSAILFAGGTVVIALLSLGVAGIPLVTSLGFASAIAVAGAVLGALTLLPALLALVGPRISSLALPALLRPGHKGEGGGFWSGWARAMTRHPWVVLAVSLVVLALLIIPVFTLTLGQEDIGSAPESTTERQAYDLIATGFGPGYNGPLLVAAELSPPAAATKQVQQQEDQLKSLQAQLQQEQKEGQQQQAALQQEGDELKADQAQLQQQQAALQAQQAQLERQAASLEAQQASLERQAAALRAQEQQARAQAASLEAQRAGLRGRAGSIRARARELEGRVRGLAAQARSLEAQGQAARARAQEIQAAIAGETRLERRRQLGAALSAMRGRERGLLAEARNLAAEARGIPAQARALRAEAEAVRRRAPALRAEAQELAARAQRFRSEAASLAAQAADLARQGAALQAQADQLQAQGAALQQQADELKARKAALDQQQQQLEQLQATAKKQQQQAEQLQDQLTAELTKAGGDARGTDPRVVRMQDALTGTGGVQAVSPPQINKAGDAVIYNVIATTAPSDPETADLVRTLRSAVLPAATAGTGTDAHVGGSTAGNVDLAAEIGDRLPWVIATVLALSFLVLLIAFRSLLVPLQAALVNLLSVGAAFGVLTACFQWGWGISLVGVDTTADTVPIASYVPLMMFAVLFGLSMDYQVFLLSSVAQHRAAGEPDRDAATSGLRMSAKVITSAGLIMIGVFGSFILNGDPTVKQFGVGLSVAVFLAALLVLTLVPALLVLMGRGTWALPGLLRRVVPRVDVEGEGLIERFAEQDAAARAAAEAPEPEPEPEAEPEPEPEPRPEPQAAAPPPADGGAKGGSVAG